MKKVLTALVVTLAFTNCQQNRIERQLVPAEVVSARWRFPGTYVTNWFFGEIIFPEIVKDSTGTCFMDYYIPTLLRRMSHELHGTRGHLYCNRHPQGSPDTVQVELEIGPLTMPGKMYFKNWLYNATLIGPKEER